MLLVAGLPRLQTSLVCLGGTVLQISLTGIQYNTSLSLSLRKCSPPTINSQLNLVFAPLQITDWVLCATQPCFSTQWCPSEGTLDHEIHSLQVHFVDVVPENVNPWLLKQEMEMGSICRHSATELEPDYISSSVINNGDQLLGGKKTPPPKVPSLEEIHYW